MKAVNVSRGVQTLGAQGRTQNCLSEGRAANPALVPTTTTMQGDAWATYLATVYGAAVLDHASYEPQLLYHHNLLPHGAKLEHPKPCFAYGGMGDRRCKLSSPLDHSTKEGNTELPQLLHYNPAHRLIKRNWNITSHTWIEVTRFGSDCFPTNNVIIGDGLLPSQSGSASSRVLNGCWFFVGSGTGVFVNVGRCLALPSRAAMDERMMSWLHIKRQVAVKADRRWCSYAVAHGFDSIAVGTESDRLGLGMYIRHQSKQVRSNAELIVCNGGCARQHVRSACPPLDLRTGVDASRSCACEPQNAILNCGNLHRATCHLAPALWRTYERTMQKHYNTSQAADMRAMR